MGMLLSSLVYVLNAEKFETAIGPFGKLPDGREATLYTMKNANGLTLDITNYGGIITRILTPDRKGEFADIVLGYDNLDGYLKSSPYFGALIGRYANRIGGASFSLEGETFHLSANEGTKKAPIQLHGGLEGWDKKLWNGELVEKEDHVALVLSLRSPDGEEGFPGDMNVKVVYQLNNDGELIVDYEATTTKPTVVNMTQHTYFNLAGEGSGDILDHELQIVSDSITAVDKRMMPTGHFMPVVNTPFDFNEPIAIGARIEADHELLKLGRGYNHNWVLNRQDDGLCEAAAVYEPTTGRTLEVWTTEPGIQFYCATFLDGSIIGKSGKPYESRSGLCLETQHYPDSPNQPNFPSTALYPGDVYKSTTVFKFGAK